MRPTAPAALRGLVAFACVFGAGVAEVSAAPLGPAPPLPGRYQEAPDPNDGDADGDASVTIEIGPRSTVNHVTFDSSGVTETAAAADGAASDVAAGQAATTSSDIGLAELAIARVLESPDTSLTVTNDALEDGALSAIFQPSPAADPVADGIVVEGVATGGQTGASVQVGDTMGGGGEPGAPGGDATVVVRTGPISGGQAVAGEATGGIATDGDGIALIEGDDAGGAASPSVPAAGIARLGSLLVLEVTPAGEGDPGSAIGGAAIGGSARGGDATVDVTIGDTIGGGGANGRPGGDAEVIIEIGPVSGGTATGGAATGGDAIQGAGSARGGTAVGGPAGGGDARVVIAIGDTIGVAGESAAGDAAVIIAIDAITGGSALGGAATGGEARGLLNVDAVGGNAAGGEAAAGDAIVALRIDHAAGSRYEADTGAIVGGDATGGTATGGDAIDLTVDD